MNKYQEKLIESIELLIEEKISKIQFNYEITGKITRLVSAGLYEFTYNGETTTAKSIGTDTYQSNDIVHVLVLNNDFSNKIILCKKL